MSSDDRRPLQMGVGETRCSECNAIIPAWLDNCPECGAHQGKEKLTILERLARAGAGVDADALQEPIEDNCDQWHRDGSIDALRQAGFRTMGDLLNRTEEQLRACFADGEVFDRIWRYLPCPDTRPFTEAEYALKARLLGFARPDGCTHVSERNQGKGRR